MFIDKATLYVDTANLFRLVRHEEWRVDYDGLKQWATREYGANEYNAYSCFPMSSSVRLQMLAAILTRLGYNVNQALFAGHGESKTWTAMMTVHAMLDRNRTLIFGTDAAHMIDTYKYLVESGRRVIVVAPKTSNIEYMQQFGVCWRNLEPECRQKPRLPAEEPGY